MMNQINKLLIIVIAVVSVRCARTSEPTSPNNNTLSLSKQFDSAAVNLNIGESITINQKFTLKFQNVTGDSRCPIDVTCVWEGNAEIELVLTNDERTETKVLNTNLEPRSLTFEGYSIELRTLNPLPRSTIQINPKEYNIDLVIKPPDTNGDETESVNLIDGSNTSVINKDILNINSAAIDKNEITFNISYSGGCEDHKIDLYALKEIEKSNPAQVTLLLSHNSNNDMCEAYITQNALFDLTELKNYLINSHGIKDKVLLIIHDPSGKPIRDPVVEYNF
ncbi:MAG: hypothetical protein AB1521_03315 [Bacteroidota bacterium]